MYDADQLVDTYDEFAVRITGAGYAISTTDTVNVVRDAENATVFTNVDDALLVVNTLATRYRDLGANDYADAVHVITRTVQTTRSSWFERGRPPADATRT
ncbi:hypothetical protein [Mycobacterium sp. 1465703.0]|uniref:hypothetical protein n=1 Tax=Mycobacterium sp. 1465703.0 TaxID=1834078 RepID=UPI00080145BB|nr:hypothetical protein [Mycobacterium sp. 1465703.0]OBI95556.1 hypothetical protein A5625_08040 [Mycobacterium sp. 1465703.0]